MQKLSFKLKKCESDLVIYTLATLKCIFVLIHISNQARLLLHFSNEMIFETHRISSPLRAEPRLRVLKVLWSIVEKLPIFEPKKASNKSKGLVCKKEKLINNQIKNKLTRQISILQFHISLLKEKLLRAEKLTSLSQLHTLECL